MGHSAGGVFTQLLMDRGYGAVGVAMNSAPTEGVKRVPLSQLKASFPVLKNPANRHRAVGLTFDQWQYTFTNTFDEGRGRELYERYHVPASGRIFWGSALANIHPGKDDTYMTTTTRIGHPPNQGKSNATVYSATAASITPRALVITTFDAANSSNITSSVPAPAM